METEMFTFVECNGYGVETTVFYGSRADADGRFDDLVETGPMFVAYYCASVGGLVNSYHEGP